MDENKNEILNVMANTEYHPAFLDKETFQIEKYEKFSLTKIASMGMAFEPLKNALLNVASNSGTASDGITSMLCEVTFPAGKQLVARTDGTGLLGAVARGNNQVGGGMATLNPVNNMANTSVNPLLCNPTTMFMAIALMSIDKKLDAIQQTQKEIFEFLEEKEKSKLRGNLIFLSDTFNNYKYNWDNAQYKNNHHMKVLDIKQESEQSILFYREQIEKALKKKSFLQSDQTINAKLNKIQSNFKEYQLALYLFAFSSFLDIMLLENFDSLYLDSITDKIDDYGYRYRELYTDCYNKIHSDSNSSVRSHMLKGIATIGKATGKAVAKIPIVGDSKIDEALIEKSDSLNELNSKISKQTMEKLINHQSSEIHPFVENIKTIKALYEKPLELIFDKENLYLKKYA